MLGNLKNLIGKVLHFFQPNFFECYRNCLMPSIITTLVFLCCFFFFFLLFINCSVFEKMLAFYWSPNILKTQNLIPATRDWDTWRNKKLILLIISKLLIALVSFFWLCNCLLSLLQCNNCRASIETWTLSQLYETSSLITI